MARFAALILLAFACLLHSEQSCAKQLVAQQEIAGGQIVPTRRKAISVTADLGDYFNFCYKDTTARVTVKTATNKPCPSGTVRQNNMCYKSCPAGFDTKSALCVYSCAASKWFECGLGCASDKKTCTTVITNQIISVADWITNILVPGGSKFQSLASNNDAQVVASVIFVPYNSNYSSDFSTIFKKTMEKRVLVATMLATFGKKVKGVMSFLPPSVQNTGSQLAAFLGSIKVPLQVGTSLSSQSMAYNSKVNFNLNIEDLAKLDATGTIQVLLQFGHPRCTKNRCAKCSITSNPCISSIPCSNGNCGSPVYEPDGTACVITDSSANTLPGFCQSGTCATGATAAYYNAQSRASISSDKLSSSGLDASKKLTSVSVKVANSIRKGSSSAYVSTALKFWDDMAFKSKSCTFNNGGCGTSVCVLNSKRTDTTCVNPTGLGFSPAPFGTDYTGKTIQSSVTDAVSCIKKCKRTLRCKVAVTTRSGQCFLKSTAGSAVSTPFYQAYVKN